MKITKRIIIRIIVAVAVAFILSKLRSFSIMSVSALTATNNFTYENQIFDNRTEVYNFSDDFANGLERGTLKTNVTISSNILYASDTRLPVLRQAIVSNGSSNNVCSIGTLSNGGVDSFSSSGVWNERTINSQTYSIECEVTPNPTIKTLTLYFSGTLNTAYISFGPLVSFRENDLLLEMKKQNESCTTGINLFDKSSVVRNFYLNQNGVAVSSNNASYSDFIYFDTNSTYYTNKTITLVYYNAQKQPVGILTPNIYKGTFVPSYPYARVNLYTSDIDSLMIHKGSTEVPYESFGEICKNKQDLALEESQKQTQAQQETNDYLKSDDHSEADSEASGFFNDFGGNNHGISGIVTAPLRLLNSLTTASCNPLTFPLPFVNKQIILPCMRGIYEQYFGVFFSLWQLITTGLISYNVSLNIYSKVRAMQNPNNDRIEVLNL